MGSGAITSFQHLFVPVDGSELGERAMRASIALAQRLKGRITGFIAEPDVPVPAARTRVRDHEREVDAHIERTDTHAHELLGRFQAAALEAGVEFSGLHVRTADVDQAIIDQAEAVGCDMIVMVTHGRSPLGEWIYGSHTKRVLAHGRLPVLVLH